MNKSLGARLDLEEGLIASRQGRNSEAFFQKAQRTLDSLRRARPTEPEIKSALAALETAKRAKGA
ncbi:MAG: hypothetical protein IPL96_04020 [Holophagaceae bacterium]|nr:hypothetical protein [Holophagaceae bacterium]